MTKPRLTTDDLRALLLTVPGWDTRMAAVIHDFLGWVDATVAPNLSDEHWAFRFQQAAAMIERLARPANEREPPHCSTCACGLSPEPRDCQCATYCMIAVGARFDPQPRCRGLPGERPPPNREASQS